MNLNQLANQWHTYYAMLGGATATLLGLLFVSLGLNIRRIHREENSHFLRLARLTFSNYLMLFVLSMQMLAPIEGYFQILISLSLISIMGLGWTVYLRNRNLDRDDPNTKFLRQSYRQTYVSYILILALCFIPENKAQVLLYFMITPVTLLTICSIKNSWGLLMMLRDQDDLK